MEIAERPAPMDTAPAHDDDVEDVLQRVRETVARTREAIAATREMLRPSASAATEEAADR